LSKSSQFFQRATKPEWDELRDQPGTINVEGKPDVFQHYLNWLYSGSIPCQSDDLGLVGTYLLLAKLYVLGEELVDIKFKNCILDTFIATTSSHREYPIANCITTIYDGTPANSPARRLMVDFVVYAAHYFAQEQS
jgi:hypothetical protein